MSGLSVYVYRATGERDGRPRATDGDTVLHLDGERMPTLAIGHCGALLRHYKQEGASDGGFELSSHSTGELLRKLNHLAAERAHRIVTAAKRRIKERTRTAATGEPPADGSSSDSDSSSSNSNDGGRESHRAAGGTRRARPPDDHHAGQTRRGRLLTPAGTEETHHRTCGANRAAGTPCRDPHAMGRQPNPDDYANRGEYLLGWIPRWCATYCS